MRSIYSELTNVRNNGSKKLAVLVDPDKIEPEHLLHIIQICVQSSVDYFFVGGSLLFKQNLEECVDVIKSYCQIPVVLFPGSPMQIYRGGDAVLLLSVVSGRNADLLIGQHVIAAPILRAARLEIISTAYMLIDGGQSTTVSYLSNTLPIPYHKIDIAVSTAMAAEMLGMKLIYLEAGSGALRPVSEAMVAAVRENTSVPLVVGGGIRSAEQAYALCRAGADLIVVGSAVENQPEIIRLLAQGVRSAATVSHRL